MVACIDNLVKGAAGQAIQNFNVAFGFAEATGLNLTMATVLKLGGELLEDAAAVRSRRGDRPARGPRPLVVVHGGGRAIDAELSAGLTPKFVDGLRSPTARRSTASCRGPGGADQHRAGRGDWRARRPGRRPDRRRCADRPGREGGAARNDKRRARRSGSGRRARRHRARCRRPAAARLRAGRRQRRASPRTARC